MDNNNSIISLSHLDSGVAAEVKVEFGGVSDADVDCRPGGNVPTLANLLALVRTKQTRVMTFLEEEEEERR